MLLKQASQYRGVYSLHQTFPCALIQPSKKLSFHKIRCLVSKVHLNLVKFLFLRDPVLEVVYLIVHEVTQLLTR